MEQDLFAPREATPQSSSGPCGKPEEWVPANWNELQEALFADAWDPDIGRHRARCAYRGLSDRNYCLESTLTRLGGAYDKLERHLLRSFRKYAHRDVAERDSLWHWLAVAKHYGLPARLLDWTTSPLVALHFATANHLRFDCDGLIWVVDYVKAHARLPEILRWHLQHEGANLFTVEMLADCVKSLHELDGLSPTPFVLFFEPPSIDDRIVNQYAFFSIASDARLIYDHWLATNPGLFRKIIIPADLKWEIRDKLDQANITERVLFPGLDGLSTWLKRYYSPKHPE
jgi:hypothetical protein